MLTGGRTDDGQTTYVGVIGIQIAHLGAFVSGELKKSTFQKFSHLNALGSKFESFEQTW